MDNDEPPVNIHKGMHIVIMQNIDKKNGVVNRQPATVLMMQGLTVILQLPNSKKVSVYPVSSVSNPSECESPEVRTCYPFVPGYAMTICKSQGQTLNNTVWFDAASFGPGAAYVAPSCFKNNE